MRDIPRQRKAQREWIAKRRSDFFADKVCVQCGSTESLELDHINPEDKVTHNIWSWAEDRRKAEIEKCQVLCHDCHFMKTQEWWRARRKHGRNMYDKYACRCDICKAAKAEQNAKRSLK